MAKKRNGEERLASPNSPAILDTPSGPVLVYRLPRGKVGIMHPPGMSVVRQAPKREQLDNDPAKDEDSA